MARKSATLRRALLESVGEEDIRAVVAELVARAKAGEPWAVRELLDRSIGKPQQVDMTEEASESPTAAHMAPLPVLFEFAEILESIPPHLLPEGALKWLRVFRISAGEKSVDPQARIEALARKGLESLRRQLGQDVELPPGTIEEQASFVLGKLDTDRPESWR